MIPKLIIAQSVACYRLIVGLGFLEILYFVVEWQCIEALKVSLVCGNENGKGMGIVVNQNTI